MTLTEIARLTESPGELKRRPDGAQYHDGETIITHLNYALEPWGWDWAELDGGYDAETDEVWVLGQLTARFVVESLDGDERTLQSVKIERGWQKVNRLRDGSAKSVGDDKKGAATDALKRCARLLGVGLDAWAKAAPDQPKKLKTKAELEADVKRGLEAGRALGLSLDDVDARRMNRADLIALIKELSEKVRQAKSGQGAAAS